ESAGRGARRRFGCHQVAFARRKKPLRVERSHTPRSGRGDRLAVRVVDHVTYGEDALDVRLGVTRLRDEVAGVVVIELLEEQARVRIVPNRREDAVSLDVPR